MILTAKTPQARDKSAHQSHHAPDIGKHDVFDAPGTKHCKTRVLEKSGEDTAGGAAQALGEGKTKIWLQKIWMLRFLILLRNWTFVGPLN